MATSTTPTMVWTTMSQLEFFISLIRISPITTNIYLWGYLFTIIFGLAGNTFSLLTFLTPKLRNVSTGCLFILLAISDSFFLLVVIVDLFEFGLQSRLYRYLAYEELCRFRVFILSVSQLFSTWLLVLITLDRWFRVRFALRSNTLCTPKRAFLIAMILLVIVIVLNIHVLFYFFGMILPGLPHLSCGANGLNYDYSTFYYYQWTIIRIFITCLGPAFLMFVMVIDMFLRLRAQKRAVQSTSTSNTMAHQRDKRLHNQMLLLMLSSIGLFLITTLPLTIDQIVSARIVRDIPGIENLLVVMSILAWIQNNNAAMSFYIHCLTSTLFRKEFLKMITCNRMGTPVTFIVQKQTKMMTSSVHPNNH